MTESTRPQNRMPLRDPTSAGSAGTQLDLWIRAALARVHVDAFRIEFQGGPSRIHCEEVRGVWGARLEAMDQDTYAVVFRGAGPEGVPRYIWREPDQETDTSGADARALELLLFDPARAARGTWRVALEQALGGGLGRRRTPAQLASCTPIGPDGWPDSEALGFDLSAIEWPLIADPEQDPLRIEFVSGTRLVRRGRLIEAPGLTDVVVACWRRVAALASLDTRENPEAAEMQRQIVEIARSMDQGVWSGRVVRLQRWSASQAKRVPFEGVVGTLDLSGGVGALATLLAAAEWMGVGKSTALGRGRMRLRDLDGE